MLFSIGYGLRKSYEYASACSKSTQCDFADFIPTYTAWFNLSLRDGINSITMSPVRWYNPRTKTTLYETACYKVMQPITMYHKAVIKNARHATSDMQIPAYLTSCLATKIKCVQVHTTHVSISKEK